MEGLSEQLVALRSDGIVSKEVGDEIVVYVLASDQVHLLNPVAASIWRTVADTSRTVRDIQAEARSRFPETDAIDELVLVALHELRGAGLLDESVPNLHTIDRRRILKLVGAAAVMAPAITTILAPPAAATHSTGGGTAWGQSPALGCTHCKPVAPSTSGVCGSDGLCGSCISNQTTACSGGATSDVQARCCTGNACTSVGTTGNRCCQPTGASVGTGTCCATNSGGSCVCTPLNQSPTVKDQAMCCSGAIRPTEQTCCAPKDGSCTTATDCCTAGANCAGNPKTCNK